MSRAVTINYARVPNHTLTSATNGDGTITFTVYYVVGFSSGGTTVEYNQPMVQGIANGISVVVTRPATDSYSTIAAAIQAAIAAQEGLDLGGGDQVILP